MKRSSVRSIIAVSPNLRISRRTQIAVTAVLFVLTVIAGAVHARSRISREKATSARYMPINSTRGALFDTGRAGQWKTELMRVTAYCPCTECCGIYSDGQTASGHRIRPGDTFVAADKRYAFGTEMLIPGYSNGEPVTVLDRGRAIYGNRLDVFFASHKDALKWGVKYIEVKIRRR